MRIADSVALVTGAGRGLGRAFVQELAERGAATIYAGARDPSQVTGPGVPVPLDVTDPDQVAAAARRCADVTLLVNNAGLMALSPLIGAPSMAGARHEIETNYFGTLAMCRAFAPVLAAGGGGAIVNMLSVVSFFTNPANGSYGASKAAAWALTNGVRIELAHQGTQVVGVHAGFIDTEMARELAGDAAQAQPRRRRPAGLRRGGGRRGRGAGRRPDPPDQEPAARRPREDLPRGAGRLGRPGYLIRSSRQM